MTTRSDAESLAEADRPARPRSGGGLGAALRAAWRAFRGALAANEEASGLSALIARARNFGSNLLLRGRFSTLTRRIVALNFIALLMLVAGVLYLNQFRAGLIDARVQSLLKQGEIIAGAIAESATAGPNELLFGRTLADPTATPAQPINPTVAAPILRRLVLPTEARARLYGKDGILILDSRFLTLSGQIRTFELPPPDESSRGSFFERLYDWVAGFLPGERLPIYREAGLNGGEIYEEVARALNGEAVAMERVNRQGELIVSVAVPVQRFKAVLGALMLSTEGGDIDAIVRSERLAILQVFAVALAATSVLAIILAATIAHPIRRLASAADQVRRGVNSRRQIPDFTARQDEIGDLSGALRDMTGALYARMEAIESFAADVAHELKNPLTSLHSATEVLPNARTPEAQTKLIDVIQHDVARLNRLITDISDASRLDAELSREMTGEVNLARLLETVIDIFNATRGNDVAKVTLSQEAGALGADGLVVDGMESRLGQVFRNLIDNALSFSPDDKSVQVTLRREGEDVIVTVEDDGPGIPPDNLETIFKRFYTERPGADSFGKNSGLGLSISRQIVDAHNGEIWAENRYAGEDEEGEGRDETAAEAAEADETAIIGARFTVRLPAAR